MTTLILDADFEAQTLAQRRALGLDRFDEVWDGVYIMAPLANNEHQDLRSSLAAAMRNAVGWDGPERVHAGANVSDREEGWLHNYRIPDVVVVYPGGAARDCDTHWCGGPDFCVEIASPGDRSHDKLDFYARIGVRELLLVDRDPWDVQLYRLANGRLQLVGHSDASGGDVIASEVVPVSFRLVPGAPRPKIEVTHRDDARHWIV